METSQLSPGRLRGILFVMGLSLMAVISAVSGLNMAIPSIATATEASLTELQWIMDAYTVVFAGLLLIAGAVGDRFGRKGILQFGLAVFTAAALAAMFATNATELITYRAIMGFAAACVMPTTLSVITTVFPKEQKPKAVGIWVGIAAGGGVIGLFAAGLLLQWFDWSSFFGFNVVLAFIALIGATFVVPKNKMNHPIPIDILGGILSLITVGGLVFGIIEGPSRGWDDVWTITALIAGVAGGILFVLWELKREHPLLDPRLFKLRGFSAGSMSIFTQFFAAFGFFFVGMQYLQFVAGLEPLQAAACILPMPFVVIPLSRFTPVLAQRVGFKFTSPLGLLLMAAGFIVFTTMGTELAYWQLLIGLLLFGIGMGFAGPPATTAIVSSLPPAKQGVASAVNDTSREVASALGIAVLGSVLNQVYSDTLLPKLDKLPATAQDALTSTIAWVNSSSALKKLGPFTDKVVSEAKDAYMSGIRYAFWIAAGVLIIGAIVISLRAPRPQHDAVPAKSNS